MIRHGHREIISIRKHTANMWNRQDECGQPNPRAQALHLRVELLLTLDAVGETEPQTPLMQRNAFV